MNENYTHELYTAQVKLVKCVVADLVVDVSFETLGGLCTVAFLESIDRKINRAHLFKRSIVLVCMACMGRLLPLCSSAGTAAGATAGVCIVGG